jgi:hypothetical protein
MRKTFKLILLSQAALLIPALISIGVNAAPRVVEENPKLVQQTTQQLGAATSRSVEQMLADQKLADQGMKPMLAPQPIPFRPKDRQKYEEMKKNAEGQAKSATGRESAQTPLAPLAPPILRGINFDGVNRTTAGGWFPPDTHGAVGNSHFVEVTNSHVDMYTKATPTALAKSVTLAAFFGYFEQSLFDPRCIYDPVWDRFIITAEAFPEVDGDQYHFIAISRTANALGAYWIYAIDVGVIYGGNFWDFPQLGMTQDALIITAHLFNSDDTFVGSGLMTFAKARVYNGLGITFPIWGGLAWNITPPIVRDQDQAALLVCADSGIGLDIYYLYNAENQWYQAALYGPYFIDTVDYSGPPNAPQPGTAELLHTGDGRFVNASTQIGNNLYQIHSVDFFGAACKWYQIDWSTFTVVTDNTFFTSGTSADFNASIAANDFNDVYVAWTSVDASAGTNAQVRISGRRNFDPPTIGAGTALFTSPTFLSGNFDPNFGCQRWGDYSAVSIDPGPANQLRAWIVNEKINTNSVWGTRIARIGF